MEDESYLNKRGLAHFWDNIDTLKQDKLTAGTNISINNNTISSSQPAATTSSLGVVQVGSGLTISSGGVLSATGGGVADSVAWGHVTGTLADQTDLQDALDAKADSSSLATVATSGSYNDLTNKPTIGNATLTIQKNGTAVDTFTANATTNKSINITVPTTAADVSALPASTKYGASITVSINTTDYKVTTTLKDQDGNTLGTAQVIDFPLESVVVNGSYDSTNKKIVLTLQNGNTIDIPVADLVAGLQTEITSSNKLASDLVDDTNQTHKFTTAADITKLAGITTGAEVNQNAFSNVKVGSTTVAADSKTDTLELVAGSNVTLTPDATNDKVTIAATDTTYSDATTSASGLMSASDKTKLNGIASGAEVNVQANWTQTTTTADDYIKNKPNLATVATSGAYSDLSGTPTLATVATSGSYNDLSNKPTIPTVNNATLTIQKNGTNVQTFTANQSTNATANITVPTKVSDLTNDSGFITSSGTAAKADQLTTGRTIAISDGATGTATSFNGTSNISIPITSMKEAYLEWGGKSLSGQVSPVDAAVDPFIGSNKWAFANAASFVYEYSTDGGATWVDCGISDADKRAVTTTPGGYTIRLGNNSTTNYANNKLRLTFNSNAAGGNVYTSLRKILIYLSTNGAAGTTVTVTSRTIGDYKNNVDNWTTVGTYNVSGWSGWNSIPYNVAFGGSATQTSQIAQIRLTFNQSGGTANMSVSHVHFIGVTNWSVPSELGKTGHLYTWDVGQNATFPANVAVTGSLKHGSYTYTLPNKNGTVAMTSDVPTVPTNVSAFTNDAGYLTSIPTASASTLGGIKVGSGLSISNGVLSTQSTAPDWSDITNKPTFATVATSGSYNDLSNKPTIPTVNNATLTIQKNGTTVQTFTANSSSNKTANITVPTTVAELSDASDYATTTDLAAKQNLLSPGNHIDITSDVISATGYVHSENPQAAAAASSTITGSMIASGTITADKLASGATVQLTLSSSDIGEGSPLAANTLYGVYI